MTQQFYSWVFIWRKLKHWLENIYVKKKPMLIAALFTVDKMQK